MKPFQLSVRLAVSAMVVITIVFLSDITPFKNLGSMTKWFAWLGIGLWFASVISFLESSFRIKKKKYYYYVNRRAIALLLIVAFIPLGLMYRSVSGSARTKIKVTVSNESDYIPKNILIYGTGSIFEKSDTLSITHLVKGERVIYTTYPVTKGNRTGHIVIEFDAHGKHVTKTLTGEFSTKPYRIQQEWEIVIDREFLQ